MDDNIKLNEEWIRILSQKQKSPKRVAKFQEFKKTHLDHSRNEIDPSTLRSKKKPNRFVVDNEYVKGHYLAKFPPLCSQVLFTLLLHCNLNRQDAFPSLITIQELSGCTNTRSIISALRILEAYGIIKIRRSPKGIKAVNVYFFQSVRYWRPLSKGMKKIKLNDPLPNWQKPLHSTGRKESYRTSTSASLTNLRENYNNKIQNIGDILRERFKIPESQPAVAIPEPSSNTIDNAKKAEDIGVEMSDKTGEIQSHRTGTSASTIDIRNNGKLTGTDTLETYTHHVDNTTQKQREDDNIKSAYE
jgi:hypothetical protein